MSAIFVRLLLILFAVIGLSTPAFAQARGPLVLAAASLQESLTAAAEAWARKGHAKPVISFAGSSALARQIASGAPADMFISADKDWMNDVAGKGLIQPRTRVSFLTNSLVLIAPANSRVRVTVAPRFPLARALGASGRLAMADPNSVPAGKYGKAALISLGVWASVQGRIASAENVRAAMLLVSRGESPLGIVYATDALADRGVKVVGRFPARSHAPITYPMALLKTSTNRDAEPFRRFLISREGKAVFARYGFGTR